MAKTAHVKSLLVHSWPMWTLLCRSMLWYTVSSWLGVTNEELTETSYNIYVV